MNVEELILRHRAELAGFVSREAGALLRYETAEDLTQGAIERALEAADGYEDQGEGEARAWIFRIARRHLSDRRRHWLSAKRDGGRVLRFERSRSASLSQDAVGEPFATGTGPSTFAFRREQLVLATKALAMLLPRDRELVRWAAEDMPLTEQAERVGISYRALVQARSRALERFRKVAQLLLQGKREDASASTSA